MTPWTDSARRCFDDYSARARERSLGTGIDVDELIDDLRRHVDAESQALGLRVVNEADMQGLLARIGDPSLLAAAPPKQPAAPKTGIADLAAKAPRVGTGLLLLFFAVVLPTITIGFELVTGMSAAALFDPMPSLLHILIVALVPAANLWIWIAARRASSKHACLLGWLNGAAFGITLTYALLYLPLVPLACIGILYFGLGLIPLAPLFATLATPLLRSPMARCAGLERLPGFFRGAALGMGLLAALQAPMLLTYHWLSQAVSDSPTTSSRAVRSLRTFGSQEVLLRHCYGQLSGAAEMDFLRNWATGGQRVSADEARAVYYRVTGRPFNAVPPPSLYTRAGRWTLLEDEFSWDDALGGDAVAGCVKGLSLSSSRLDAVAEPDAALAYCEWTMEFKNVSRTQREARAQIALPPGGVVSRLTLWVNGEEREAAFAGRSEVKEAYRQVAIVKRRDPVLVTTAGPDRVLMQCFPVPPDGGSMKIRIGITAPLELESASRGQFLWPRYLERNFAIRPDFKHSLWMDSPRPLEGPGGTITTNAQGGTSWRMDLPESTLQGSPMLSSVLRQPEVSEAWCPAQDAGRVIHQTLQSSPQPAFKRVVIVVDGSAGMKAHVPDVIAALPSLDAHIEIAALWAGDEIVELMDAPQVATPATIESLARSLRQQRSAGGQDNLPALERAWDLAAASERGAVLWIHAAQPMLLSSDAPLRQRLDRSSERVQFFDLQAQAGPNRVIEALDGLGSVHMVPSRGTLKSGLTAELQALSGRGDRLTAVRKVVESAPPAAHRTPSRHIERLWAADEIKRRLAARDTQGAVELAGRHQLVTTCSGAVVLETKQQYDQANLTPANPATVPTIPEPGVVVLLLLGFAAIGASARRRRGGDVSAR
jgi:hypothetical protein